MKNKRKKVSRHRGSHTHGRGAKKKARGKGHRGGVGKSGTGKRGDQKKTLVTKEYGGKYFGKDKTRRAAPKKEIKSITLQNVADNIKGFVRKGLAKEVKGSYELNLKKYKIIGSLDKGSTKLKLKISAYNASKGAKESVKQAGGEINIEYKTGEKEDES